MKDTKLEKEIRFVTVFKKVTKDKFWKALQTRIAPLISQVRLRPAVPPKHVPYSIYDLECTMALPQSEIYLRVRFCAVGEYS